MNSLPFGEASDAPTFDLPDDKFGMLDANRTRAEQAKKVDDEQPQAQSKYGQAHSSKMFRPTMADMF